MAEEKLAMERLNAVNWPTWSFQMRNMLRSRGLWKHVDGTETLPEGANEQKKNEYETRQAKAFGLIVMSVASSHIYLITSTESPAEAWKLLQEHFQKDTLNNRIYLKKRYFRMEMTEGKSIQQHLKEMKELTDRLAAIQCPIDEEDQVVTLLGSLPRSYATLVTALETRTGKLDLASVQQALTHEEMKLNEGGTGASGDAHDAALLGTQKTNRDNVISQGRSLHQNVMVVRRWVIFIGIAQYPLTVVHPRGASSVMQQKQPSQKILMTVPFM